MQYKNITVENLSYSLGETVLLVKTAKNSMIENVTVSNSNLPIVGKVEGSFQKIGITQGIKGHSRIKFIKYEEDTKGDLKEIINN